MSLECAGSERPLEAPQLQQEGTFKVTYTLHWRPGPSSAASVRRGWGSLFCRRKMDAVRVDSNSSVCHHLTAYVICLTLVSPKGQSVSLFLSLAVPLSLCMCVCEHVRVPVPVCTLMLECE